MYGGSGARGSIPHAAMTEKESHINSHLIPFHFRHECHFLFECAYSQFWIIPVCIGKCSNHFHQSVIFMSSSVYCKMRAPWKRWSEKTPEAIKSAKSNGHMIVVSALIEDPHVVRSLWYFDLAGEDIVMALVCNKCRKTNVDIDSQFCLESIERIFGDLMVQTSL